MTITTYTVIIMLNKEDADTIRTLGTFTNREEAEEVLGQERRNRQAMGKKYELYAGKIVEGTIKL